MTPQDQAPRGPGRALLIIDELVLADVVKLALSHSQYDTRIARTVEDAAPALLAWRPHLLVLDMETTGSAILEQLA
jgi:DNA-binding response OmpR family regulator